MSRRPRANEGPAYKADAERNTGPDNLKSGNSDIKSENLGAGNTKSGPKYSRPEPGPEPIAEPAVTNPTSATGGYTDAIGTVTANTDNFTFANTDTAKRGPGRPPGSKNRTRREIPAGTPLDISGIEKLLLGIHTSLARLIPEAELSPSEAHELASAYSDVAQYYPILRLPDKWAATINFGTQLALVYGSRFAAWRIRVLSETPTRPPQQPQTQTQEVLRNVFETQPPKANGRAPEPPPPPKDVRTGEIPGVGNIEFPSDHELLRGRKIN